MKTNRDANFEPIPTAPVVPKRWAWHYRALLALRDSLLAERGALLQAAAEPLEPHSMDEADSATDEFDHDLALAELSEQQDGLYEVEQALQRILDGTYGMCEQSGKSISAARLRAVPWARFGLDVAKRLERVGAVARPRFGKAERLNDSEHIFADEEVPEPADTMLRLQHEPAELPEPVRGRKRKMTKAQTRRPPDKQKQSPK